MWLGYVCRRTVLNVVAAWLALYFGMAQAGQSWWSQAYLGSATVRNRKCRNDLPITVQSPACIVANAEVKPVLREAIRAGVKQCALAFRAAEHAYNCSVQAQDRSLFGVGITQGTHRESAFVYGLLGASVAHGIARACAAGRLGTMCACGKGKLGGVDGPVQVGWEWGQCSDDVAFGRRVARALVGSKTKQDRPRSRRRTIHMQNYGAGTLSASKDTQLGCKCYGASGSCVQKTCHSRQPPDSTITGRLWERYEDAKEVAVRRKSDGSWRLRLRGGDNGKPGKDAFVYNAPSPTYCHRNAALGYPGTRGRQCFLDEFSRSSCATLCCGRGHRTRIYTETYGCNCTYAPFPKWVCSTCTREVAIHTCD